MTALIAIKEGIDTPAFGVALTLSFIVLLDANSLRQAIGKHAVVINHLAKDTPEYKQLRERMGHTKIEILAGVLVGCLVAYLASTL
ncbi:acid phosphatase [Acinetobacter sp. neg1]|nr:acid phosphatase [Acinetobacter sp. neg1]